MITITNNFTGKVTSVNPSLPMTRRKADAIRAQLCAIDDAGFMGLE